MARQQLTAALLLICVAAAAAAPTKVTTQIKNLSVRNADSTMTSIMAGDSIIISGRLAYGGDGGPSVSRLVVCQDTRDSAISGTGMTAASGMGKNKFRVTLNNVMAGQRRFKCTTEATRSGGKRYTRAADTIALPIDEGGTAPPTPTPSPPPPKKMKSPPPPQKSPPPPETQSPTCSRPKRCNTTTDYRATCSCMTCLSASSPYYRMRKAGNSCAPPYTANGSSTMCAPAPLVALVQSKGNPKATVSCITTEDRQFSLLFSTMHKGYLSFFNQNSIRQSSLKVDNDIPVHGTPSLVQIGNVVYKKYTFIDHQGRLDALEGGVVKVLGTLTAPGSVNYCFQSFVRVCDAGVNPGK